MSDIINVNTVISNIKNYNPKEKVTESVRYLNHLSPNIIIFIMYGLLYDVVINIYKPFATKFLTRLGGSASLISLYNSLPGIVAAIVLLPGTLFLSRFTNIKKVTSVILLISRMFLLLAAFVPFVPNEMQPIMFVILISVMNFPDALSQSALTSSLGSFFRSGHVRAQAISLRNKFGNFFIPIVTLATGLIISIFPKNDDQVIIFYQIFFIASFLIGLIELKTFNKFKVENVSSVQTNTNPLSSVKEVFKNKNFTRYTIFTLIFYFCWQGGWALSSIYQIQNLGANELWLALFAVGSGVSSFFAAGFWGKQISKKGNQKTMVLAAFYIALNMFLIGISPNLPIMFLVCCYSGFAVIGINISLLNGLLSATPDENRMIYIGVYNTFVNISLGISPLISLILVNSVGLVTTMFIVGSARLFSAFLLYLYCAKLKKA